MAQLKYNDYTITGLDRDYSIEFTGYSYIFSQVFVMKADSYADLKTELDDMFAVLGEPYKDLEVKYGNAEFFKTNQATHVGGFNCMPSVKKIPEQSAGLFTKYIFSVEVTIPADSLGDAPFADGLAQFKMSVSVDTTGLIGLSCEGQWRVISSSGDDAKKRYIENALTTLKTHYITPQFTGLSFDVLSDEYFFDYKNKVLNFKMTLREVIFSYTGGGGTKYILKSLSLGDDKGMEMGKMPEIEGTKAGGGDEPGDYDDSTAEYDDPASNKSTKNPIINNTKAVIAFTKSTTTESDAIKLYETEIQDWLLAGIKKVYSAQKLIVEKIVLDYDNVLNYLSVFISTIAISDSIKSFTAEIMDTKSPSLVLVPVATAEDYTKMVYTTGAERSLAATLMVTMIDKVPNEAFFTSKLPKGIDPSKKGEVGWLYTMNKMTSIYVTKALDKEHTYYTKGYVAIASWTKVSIPAKVDMRIAQRKTEEEGQN